MHILIISDAYPPMRTSCATQIYDLAQAFLDQCHDISIIIPVYSQKKPVEIFKIDGPLVYSVRCFKNKDVGYIRRTLAELINPFVIGFRLKRNQYFIGQKFDGIVWYSPTIFWGPLVKQLKALFNCKTYLILRDIFPDWALDLGLLKKNIIYNFLKKIEHYQYEQANIIGVQSPNNLEYFRINNYHINARIEVLWNWVAINEGHSITKVSTKSNSNISFIYAGNLGIAQGVSPLLNLVDLVNELQEGSFIFVGRGINLSKIRRHVEDKRYKNVTFKNEVPVRELQELMLECDVGIICLDLKHNTHNIPGKFFTYLFNGLPVLAILNPKNDLLDIININDLGVGISSSSHDEFIKALNKLKQSIKSGTYDPLRLRKFIINNYSSLNTASQISIALKH